MAARQFPRMQAAAASTTASLADPSSVAYAHITHARGYRKAVRRPALSTTRIPTKLRAGGPHSVDSEERTVVCPALSWTIALSEASAPIIEDASAALPKASLKCTSSRGRTKRA